MTLSDYQYASFFTFANPKNKTSNQVMLSVTKQLPLCFAGCLPVVSFFTALRMTEGKEPQTQNLKPYTVQTRLEGNAVQLSG